nr:MAG TPA: DNA polymerase I [Caudoviricetes sp.]
MKHLSIDIETKSREDISNVGLYKYAQSDDFSILLFAYKIDDEDVQIVDLTAGEVIPATVVAALSDKDVVKHAYNAAFEWYCLNRAGYKTPIDQWRCTMVHALYCGYPAGLANTGKAIGLSDDKQKMKEGKDLIRYFCVPCKPSKANGGRTWNLPEHDRIKWALFKDYCKRDVEAESTILQALSLYPVPLDEEIRWYQDTLMNARGARIDFNLVVKAAEMGETLKDDLIEEAKFITGLENPNSIQKLVGWVRDKGVYVDNLRKETVTDLLDRDDLDINVRRVLEIRQQLGKSSISKYQKMLDTQCGDGRVRGLTQFYGANATGRWAGRLVQAQNLPRVYIDDLDQARAAVIRNDVNYLKEKYGDIGDTLSQLIRTAFIPSEGNKLVVADFSAIEARVIAWLADETWVNEVFATHGRIYEATAANMFHVDIEKIKKGNPEYELRQKGKVATLALGYQGGVGALIAMNALKMGIEEHELQDIVDRWRAANPHIKQSWYGIEAAAIRALKTAQPQTVNKGILIEFIGDKEFGQSFLTIKLPSGRKLYYTRPKLGLNQFGNESIYYQSTNQKSGKFQETNTYGGKLTENIVQAIARDCLVVTLDRLNFLGLNYVFHVHDEVVIDAPQTVSLDYVCDVMSQPIGWAKGLILKAAGFESEFYKKD